MSETVLYALDVAIGIDASEFVTGRTALQRDLSGLRESLSSFGEQWMKTGKRLTIGLTAPLGAFGLASVKAASDAQELDSAFGETFGNLTAEMRDWAEATGDAMGRSTQSMQDMANTFGIFFNQAAPTRKEAAEMSKTFAVLAQDLSSFYNVSESVALQKLRSGLSGESEPLRDFGVFLTEATVKAKGLEMGLGGVSGELTEQEKIMARYALILETTTDAQGDVERTSDGFANKMRELRAAFDELRVVIGEKLLPLLTPIVTGFTSVLNAFTNLPSPIQNVLIAIGAFAAALGPMMLITGTLAATVLPLFAAQFGPIGLAISAFINPLGTAISLLAQFAIKAGGMSILQSIAGIVSRFLGPIGLLVTAGTLIYQNWDRIAPVFEEFWRKAEAALGPPLQELIGTVSRLMDEFWNGPMGQGVRSAIALAQEFGAAVSDIFGDVVIAVLEFVLDRVIVIFEQIGDAIRIVNALLNGDFASAWEAAKRIVQRFLEPISTLARFVIDQVRKLYEGVKYWITGKLGEVWDGAQRRIEQVKGYFFDLYDAVVGNSYVPDMVNEIGLHMDRLDALMVDPARKATANVAQTMRDMARETQAILAEAFPIEARLREVNEKLKAFDRAADSIGLSDSARSQGRRNLLGVRGAGALSPELQKLLSSVPEEIEMFPIKLREAAEKTQVQTVRIAETFEQMTNRALGALRSLSDGIRQGDFFSILEGVVGVFTSLGSFGVFGSKIQANLRQTPGFANGGAMRLGGFAGIDTNMLSLNGTPIARVTRGETMEIRPANDRGGAGGALQVSVTMDPSTGALGAFVRDQSGRVVAEAAPSIASGGAALAQGQMAQRAARRYR